MPKKNLPEATPVAPPILSIIIPHHNRPEMLAQLIASIPDDPEIEIIVIDDHSDNRPCLDTRSNVIVAALGTGQRYAGTARNLGLALAQGDWIGFADSDDLFDPEALARLLGHLQSCDDDLVVTRVDSFHSSDGRRGTRHVALDAVFERARSGDRTMLVQHYAPMGKFVRRSLIEGEGLMFDPTRVSNDVIYSARLALCAPKTGFVDEILYRVREGHASLTSIVDPAAIAQRIDVLIRFNSLLRARGAGRYVVPAIGQLRALARRWPLKALKLAIHARLHGTPIAFTRLQLEKAWARLRKMQTSAREVQA